MTLTWLLTDNFEKVCVWGRDCDISDELRMQKHTSKPLEIQLKDKVEVTSNLQEAVKDADIILLVVATSGIRDVCKQLAKIGLNDRQVLVNTSKGLELPSLMRMSQVMKEERRCKYSGSVRPHSGKGSSYGLSYGSFCGV